VNADTPGHDGAALMRPTDHARLLIRKAQLALAGLAVPVALLVGVIATDPETVQLAAVTGVEMAPLAERYASEQPASAPGALARAEEIATRIAAAPSGSTASAAERRQAGLTAGLTVGLGTLLVCWTLLIALGALWRRRLAARDLRDWATGWAQVEPYWSNRTV
jgi:hypothetical protein